MPFGGRLTLIIPEHLAPGYCPRCGAPITNQDAARVLPVDGGELTPFRRANNHTTWASAVPVATAIVLARVGDACLVAVGRTLTLPRPGLLGLPNGHTGFKSFKDTAIQEAYEELGLPLDVLREAYVTLVAEHVNLRLGVHRAFVPLDLGRFSTLSELPSVAADGKEMSEALWANLEDLDEREFVFPCHLRNAREAAWQCGAGPVPSQYSR